MSPRAYRLGERQDAVDETRRAIVNAARKLLTAKRGPSEFSVDAVAREAGVARMTVYYQFASKSGLLQALVDDIARRADMRRMRDVFAQPDFNAALAMLVAIFGRLYSTDRVLIRRLQALGELDRDVGRAMDERNAWRREALANLFERWNVRADAVDVVHALTSFATFDALAGASRTPADAVPAVLALAQAYLREMR